MKTPNNPAERLHVLLLAAKQNPKLRQQEAIKAWASLLLVPDGNESLILRRLGGVMDLPMQIKEQISSIPEIEHALYLRWMPKIEGAFRAHHLGGGFAGFLDTIDDTTLFGIEHCASLLARRAPELGIKPEDLESIANEVADLVAQVRDSEIEEDLKLFILKHLYTIRKAIDEYQLFGAKPLSTAMGEAMASLVTDPETAIKVSNTTQGQQLWRIVKRLSLVFAAAEGGGKLVDRVLKQLGWGGE